MQAHASIMWGRDPRSLSARQLAQGGTGIKLIAWYLTRLHCSRQLVASEVEG